MCLTLSAGWQSTTFAVRLVAPDHEALPELEAVGVLPRVRPFLAQFFAPELEIPPPPPTPPCSDEEDEEREYVGGRDDGCRDPEAAAGGVKEAQADWTQFALLGADIMVDAEGRLWLLEFNHNPALPQLDLREYKAAKTAAFVAPPPQQSSRSTGADTDVYTISVADAETIAETVPSPATSPQAENLVGGAFATHIVEMTGRAIALLLAADSSDDDKDGGAGDHYQPVQDLKPQPASAGDWVQVHG